MNLKEEIISKLQSSDHITQFYLRYFPHRRTNGKRYWTVSCPFHDDRNPSLSIDVSTGSFKCFACDARGDIFEFRMRVESMPHKACLNEFASELGITCTDGRSILAKPSNVQIKRWARVLFSKTGDGARSFLNEQRGLTDDTLKKFTVGYDPDKRAIIVPVFDQTGNSIVQLRFFRYDFKTGKKKIWSSQGSSVQIFGLQYLYQPELSDHQVIIAEGEMDAMILHQSGFLSVSGTGGAKTWNPAWSSHFKGRRIVICYDSDKAGRNGCEKVVNNLVSEATSLKAVDLFEGEETKEMKDVSDFFVKAHRTSGDFQRLIDQTEIHPRDIRGIPIDLYRALESDENKIVVTPAQDVVGGVFYYAVRIKEELHLVTSERKCFSLRECTEYGLDPVTEDVSVCRFPGKSVLRFLQLREEPNPSEIFEEVQAYIRRFVRLKEPEAYPFLSLWTMGTYLFRAFRYYPYVHLNGPKGSGKTLLMEILSPVCFNGEISVNSTEAVLFRETQNNQPTMFLDEVEGLRKKDKERYYAVISVLNSGFTRSGRVKRCGGKNKDKVLSFATYCPKMLAGINELDEVLRDRTIRVNMIRRRSSERVEIYRETKTITGLQEKLREQLYHFGLSYGPQISEFYNSRQEDTIGLDHLTNRGLDIWTPVIVLANFVDAARADGELEVTNSVIDLSKRRLDERLQDDSIDNETVMFLNVLDRMTRELVPTILHDPVKWFDSDAVLEFFKQQDEFSWNASMTKSWLSRHLSRLEIEVGRNIKVGGKQKKHYGVNLTKLNDYRARYITPEDAYVTVTESVTAVGALT